MASFTRLLENYRQNRAVNDPVRVVLLVHFETFSTFWVILEKSLKHV